MASIIKTQERAATVEAVAWDWKIVATDPGKGFWIWPEGFGIEAFKGLVAKGVLITCQRRHCDGFELLAKRSSNVPKVQRKDNLAMCEQAA